MDAIQALKSRRSVRAYQSRQVPRDVLSDIVDCARLAPCAMNRQVWEFVVITNPATCAQLGKLIPNSPFLPQVPACIAVLVKDHPFYVEDGSAATVNMLLAARAHGLGSCWISGDKQPYADAVRQLVGAPAEYKLVSLVAVGYAAESAENEKRGLDQVIHWEKF